MLDKLRNRTHSGAIDQPVSGVPSSGQPIPPRQTRSLSASGKRVSSIPKMAVKAMLSAPEVPKLAVDRNDSSIPHEMVPVLTLLASHGSRIYNEGYFMVLSELNNDGEPVADRKWTEVYGTLQGTIITMWDAAQLDVGKTETSFINLTDGYMRSVESLGPDLQNVIVLSTTMKNRFLLQFGTRKLFNEWTAALRLSAFERTSLQEAYTGALLSSKGPKLNGIRTMLMEAHHRTELWCNIRFGVGMPWKRVWTVITPHALIKEKKERKRRENRGKVEFFADSKEKKKKPLATIHNVSAAFAVFPEKSVLMNVSSLIKMECFVEFEGDPEVKESAIFLMPEQHPGVQGFETLIRTLIPLFDVYRLYGRPKRLNADKNDLNSLLFGMPTLPKAYYLDVVDIFMLAALPDSLHWSSQDWNSKIKELIARKLAVGYKGTGNIHDVQTGLTDSDESSSQGRFPTFSSSNVDRQRAVSEPHGAPNLFAAMSNGSATSYDAGSSTSSVNKHAPAMPSPLQNSPLQHSRPAPRAPVSKGTFDSPDLSYSPSGTPSAGAEARGTAAGATMAGATMAGALTSQSTPVNKGSDLLAPPTVPKGPRAEPAGGYHQRVKSEGQNVESGLLSPQLSDMRGGFGNSEAADPQDTVSHRASKLTVASADGDSFVSANDKVEPQEDQTKEASANMFDPTYRPAHQSYAAYSEYMHQYLKSMPRSEGANGEKGSEPGAQFVAAGPASGGAITTAVEDSDDDDDDDEGIVDNYSTLPNDAFRPSTPQKAQLLSTPIRSPAISHDFADTTPKSATRDVSTPQHTALSGPRIPVYPNAPGSPGKGSNDSLQYPSSVGRGVEQRRPSGPRDEPGGFGTATYSPNSSKDTLDFQTSGPQSGQEASYGDNSYQQQPIARSGPLPPNSSTYYGNQPGFGQPMIPQGAPYGGGSPYGAPRQQQQQPMRDPMVRQGPLGAVPQAGGASRNPFAPPGGGAWPNPYASRPNGPQGMPPQGMPPQGMPPQGMSPQGIPHQGMSPQGMGMPQGMPNGGGPRPMPSQGFGLRGAPAYNPYSQPQGQQPSPQQAGKPGQPPRSFNEARAQQLKSMRAQAMGGGSFGI